MVSGRCLRLRDGRKAEIVSPGRLNRDAGPDFFNAKLRVGKTVWAGNVEIHVHASDWYRHGHDRDRAYDSVILHVVAVDDAYVCRSDGSEIAQAELTLPPDFFAVYAGLESSAPGIRCQARIPTLEPLAVTDWLETLAVERMQMKAGRVAEILRLSGGDWAGCCFVTVARALGFGLNGLPFEMMARSLPLKYIHRHGDNPFQVESLLLGQAGMLDHALYPDDAYYQSLCGEYSFLRRKYGLNPIDGNLWKYSRTRPQNFPHRRLAMLARAFCGSGALMSDILSAAFDPDRLRDLFRWNLDGYWATHYTFGSETQASVAMSGRSIDLLVVNAALPLLYCRYSQAGDYDSAEKVFDVLRLLPSERNAIVDSWRHCGINCSDSMGSQALIHLRREYCDENRCFVCRFGFRLLRKSISGVP